MQDKLVPAEAVTGVLLLGSVIGGTSNVRSDIDMLVLYSDAREKSVLSLVGKIVEFANLLCVPVEPILISQELAQKGIHTITHSFFDHLAKAAKSEGLIKGDPVQCISMQCAVDLKTCVRQYLQSKIRYFVRQITLSVQSSNQEVCRFCGKVLDFPLHICRMMLRVWGEDVPLGDRKSIVTAYSRSECVTPVMRDILQDLLGLNCHYDQELTHQLKKPSRQKYEAIISQISSEGALLALRFAKLNAQLLL